MAAATRRILAICLICASLGGCSAMTAKPGISAPIKQQVATAGDPALDADIQRILAAGGINAAAPLPAASTASTPTVAAPAVSAVAVGLPSLPPPPTSVALSSDPAARLDLSTLAATGETTAPVVSTTATTDFSSKVTMPPMAGLMAPPTFPGMGGNSFSAGILPAVPMTTVVTNITGDNAQPAQAPRRSVQPVLPAPMPSQIQAVRQAGASSPAPRPTASVQTQAPTATAPIIPASLPPIGAPSVNTDRPLAPIKRF